VFVGLRDERVDVGEVVLRFVEGELGIVPALRDVSAGGR
jgi:hypothetical protein